MPTVSLQSAVVAVLTDFIQAQRSFSAHNVTTEIRNRVNAGTFQVEGLALMGHPSGQGQTQFIGHDLVRPIVHSEIDTLVVPGYIAATRIAPNGQGYILYEFNQATATVAAQRVRVHRTFGAHEETQTLVYIENKHADNILPTLKAIQSRLKDVSVTCADLAAFIQGAGYTLTPSVNNVDSARQVLLRVGVP